MRAGARGEGAPPKKIRGSRKDTMAAVTPPLFGQMDPPPSLVRLAAACHRLQIPYRSKRDLNRVIEEMSCNKTDCSLQELQRRVDAFSSNLQESPAEDLRRAVHLYKTQHERNTRKRHRASYGDRPRDCAQARGQFRDGQGYCDEEEDAENLTLVRQCRDAGVALVPCDPMDGTCPPPSRLAGTPYENMYSVLGEGSAQLAVRCVPPEMIRISQDQAPAAALTVEQQERRLDERLHAAMARVDQNARNVEALAGWTTKAPCGAIMGRGACARVRFEDVQEGGRCLYSGAAQQCHDNLVETRKKLDAASLRIIQLVRRVRQRLRRVMSSTQEESVEEALDLVARGMEQQAHAEHVCSTYKKKKDQCEDTEQKYHRGTSCEYNAANQTCKPFSCNTKNERTCKEATYQGQQDVCHWDMLQDPPQCRAAQTCMDRKDSKGCAMDNQCMWTGSDCRNGVDAVYHLMNVVDRAEKQHSPTDVHKHLSDILVDKVLHDETEGLQVYRTPPTQSITTQDDLDAAVARHKLGPAYAARLRSELRRYGEAKMPTAPFRAGGLPDIAPKTVAGVVKVMAHVLRKYNTVLKLGAVLQRQRGAVPGPAFQSALRLDGTCQTGASRGCAGAQRHEATRNITWDQKVGSKKTEDPPKMKTTTEGASATDVALKTPLSFEHPVLELES